MRNWISAEMLLLAARELGLRSRLRAWVLWLVFPFARRELRRWSATSGTLQRAFRPQERPRLVRPMAFAAAMTLALVLLVGSAVAVVGVVQARQGHGSQWQNAVFSPGKQPVQRRLD